MAEAGFQRTNSSRRSPVHRACDLCHQKKIRCDRKDPCESCIEVSARCLRTRPRQTKRATAPKSNVVPSEQHADTLLARMTRLEDLITSRLSSGDSNQRSTSRAGDLPSPSSQRSYLGARSPTTSTDAGNEEGLNIDRHNGSDSQRDSVVESREISTSLPPNTRQQFVQDAASESSQNEDRLPAAVEAQTFMQQEIDASHRMDSKKLRTLESAIRVAHDLSVWQSGNVSDGFDAVEEVDLLNSPFPNIEYLHLMLYGDHSRMLTSCYLEYSSHVSRQTLEKMGTALIDGSVSGQTRLQYIICVNFYAYVFLGAVDSNDTHDTMQKHLKGARKKYTSYILKALENLTILATPNLTLLQALVSGAMFLQDVGHPGKSWQISNAACRVCAALGGRFLANLALEATGTFANEVRRSFVNCYVLDKALSMAFDRTACLPDMKINLNVLAPPGVDPANDIITVFLSFAQVQDLLMRETKAHRTGGFTRHQKLELAMILHGRMRELRGQIRVLRSKPPHSEENMFIAEWNGIDFTSFSLMTTILRLHPSLDSDPAIQSECLSCARSALQALRRMNEHKTGPSKNPRAMLSALSWTLLLYPLSPFFMVFCNVVANEDINDFMLLKQIADGLSMFAEVGQSLSRVQRLCNELVALCKPVVENQLSSRKRHRQGDSDDTSRNGKSSQPSQPTGYPHEASSVLGSAQSLPSLRSSLPSISHDTADRFSDEGQDWTSTDLNWKAIDFANANSASTSNWITQDMFWQRVDMTKPYVDWFTDDLWPNANMI